jgi:hypothetical protein
MLMLQMRKTNSRYKKASSPLFATIALLIFALSLGFLLIAFDPYVKRSDDICRDVHNIKVLNIKNYQNSYCQVTSQEGSNNSLKILLRNEAESSISGLHITFIGNSEDPIYVFRDYDVPLSPGSVVSKRYAFPKSIGSLNQVLVSVYKQIGKSHYLCRKSSAVLGSIPECED